MAFVKAAHGFDRQSWQMSVLRQGRTAGMRSRASPVHKGGEFWEPSNLQALCRPCHFAKSARENSRRKHALMPAHRREWRNMVEDLLNKY